VNFRFLRSGGRLPAPHDRRRARRGPPGRTEGARGLEEGGDVLALRAPYQRVMPGQRAVSHQEYAALSWCEAHLRVGQRARADPAPHHLRPPRARRWVPEALPMRHNSDGQHPAANGHNKTGLSRPRSGSRSRSRSLSVSMLSLSQSLSLSLPGRWAVVSGADVRPELLGEAAERHAGPGVI
jgi:hypothetical protein